MTIGFDAKRLFYNRTGLGSYSRTALMVLKKFFPHNQYVLFVPSSNKKPVYTPDQMDKVVFSTQLPAFLWRSFGLKHTSAYKQLDLFHGLSGEIPLGSSSVPRIVTIHDLIFLRFPKFYSYFDVKIYDFKARFAVKNSELIISISNATKADIVEFYKIPPQKIRVVYQSYNPIFNNQLPETEKQKIREKYSLPKSFILFVGTIEPRKNLLSVLKAMERFNIDYPLVAVGRGKKDYFPQIKRFLQKSKIKNRVFFVHQVLFEDLPALYQSALIFVYPSLYEGFGIPVIEAQQSGVPVITSNVSSLPEAAGNHSILINPLDIDQLGQALQLLLNDEQKRKQMIQAGLEYVKRFSPQNFAQGLMEVYKEIVGN